MPDRRSLRGYVVLILSLVDGEYEDENGDEIVDLSSRVLLRKKFWIAGVKAILQFVCQGARALKLDKGPLLADDRSA